MSKKKTLKPKAPKVPKLSRRGFEQLRLLLQQKQVLQIVLVSNSMAPLLPTGATASITACSFDILKVFDIVVFWSDGKLICHVNWGMGDLPAANQERVLITRGLGSAAFDFPVPESYLLGRVTSHSLSKWWRLRLTLASLLRRDR